MTIGTKFIAGTSSLLAQSCSQCTHQLPCQGGRGRVRPLKFHRGRGEMRRFPRSLSIYIAASTIYAALVFLAVHAVYGVELGRAGLRLPDPEALIGSIDSVSFIVWLGISLIAGVVLYRL